MKRFFASLLIFFSFSSMNSGQVSLLNKTGKRIEISIKFFHNQAQQQMVIKDFALDPLEKTKFPQDKDLHIASPLNICVKRVGDHLSTCKAFVQDDPSVQHLDIIERGGRLQLVKVN